MLYRSVCLTVLMAVMGVSALAQESQQGTITGFITDTSKAAVTDAEITVSNLGTGASRTARSDQTGLYTIVGLEPGTYAVRSVANGFKTAERKGIIIDIGSSVRVSFTLEVGAISETVEVQAEAPVLKTETGEVSTLVSGKQLEELSLNGRNFTQLLALGPGVVSRQVGHQMGLGQEGNPLMSVHGGRISMNKYTYDGTLAMDTGGNRGLDLFPPMEAIGEVRVQKSNYSADVGGFGYGIVNIETRSGSRQYHGALYEYLRNDILDARNTFSTEREAIRLNNFGYTFGGPFFIPGHYNQTKTKDFLFWSQSWARRVGPQITSFTSPPRGVFTANVPSLAMRSGDFSEWPKPLKNPAGGVYDRNLIPPSDMDANALLLINAFYPPPNRNGAPNFVYNTHSFTLFREEILRWDHNFNQKWIWSTRYGQDDWSQRQDIARPGGPGELPTFPNLIGKPGKNLTSRLTTIFAPNKVNSFTFGYSYNAISNFPLGGFRPPGLTIPKGFPSNRYNLAPNINVSGYVGIGLGNPLNNSNPVYTTKDDFSWTRGRQSFKFGMEILRLRKATINNANEQGTFTFNGDVTGNGFADFLIGRAFLYTENDRDPGAEVSAWDHEFYAQDDIRVNSRLTINAGVRFYLIRGRNGGAAEDDNISTFVPSLYDPAMAPSLLPDGQVVAGSGDLLNGIITGSDRKGLDVGRSLTRPLHAVGPRFGIAYSFGSKTVLRGGYGVNSFWGTGSNENRKNNPPFSNSVNVQQARLSNPLGGTSRFFPANVDSLEIFARAPHVQSWSFTIQREVMADTSLEIAYAGTKSAHLPRSIQLNQADPFRSGNANLRRPYLGYGSIPYNENSAESHYHALEVSLTRRYSRGLSLEASYTFAKALGHPEDMPADSRNKNLDYGPLDLDQKHSFRFNYVWELPFLKGQNGFAAALFAGWQLSGIVTLGTGFPLTVTQSGDAANFGGNTGAQRPDIIGDPNAGGGHVNRWFNTDAFRTVTQAGRIGTSPIGVVRGPGIANVDTTLIKNIVLREPLRLQLGIETFNTFNHPQYEGVGAQINGPSFGNVTGARDPRVMQLRGKLTF